MTESDRAVMQQALDVLKELSQERACNIDPFTFGRWGGYVSIKSLRAAIAQPVQQTDIQKQLADLHQYEEIAEHYAKCAISPEALRDWVVTAQVEQKEPEAWQWLDSGHFRKSLPATADPSAWRPLYANAEPAQQPVVYAGVVKIDAATQTALDKAFANWEIKLCTDAIKQGNVTIRKPLK